jgi:Flp pilus assembly protein protease CpaA
MQGELNMPLNHKQINGYLYTVEAVGAIFVGLFLTVYLLGLRDVPKDVVYHSDPTFRMLLSTFGVLAITLVLIGILAAFLLRNKK